MQHFDLAGIAGRFACNDDPASFREGDFVSYRVTGCLEGLPFIGCILEVHDDHVIINPDPSEPGSPIRGTREAHPLVSEEDALN